MGRVWEAQNVNWDEKIGLLLSGTAYTVHGIFLSSFAEHRRCALTLRHRETPGQAYWKFEGGERERACSIWFVCRMLCRTVSKLSSSTLRRLILYNTLHPSSPQPRPPPPFTPITCWFHSSGAARDSGVPNKLNGIDDGYAAIDLALDSVVKIFTVASSPSYLLPWQNKSQRETMGSGVLLLHSFIHVVIYY